MKVFKRIIPLFAAVLMIFSLAACGSGKDGGKTDADKAAEATAFPKFQGTDFEGNEVDESLFSKNEVTLVNFWFNGCSACVDEMPALEAFNKQLKEKGAELVGVNVEAGGDSAALEEAKKILAKQGATYRNIALKEGKEIDDYIGKIYGYPTTVLVDRNGNIIGEPILGSIDNEETMANIMKMVDDTIAGKPVSSEKTQTGGDEITSLIEEENAIFESHMELWAKVFDAIPKEKAAESTPMEYLELLKGQIESDKASFTEEELKTLHDDVQKIEEIEQKIQELENAK